MLPSGTHAPPEDGVHRRCVRRPHPKVAAAAAVQVGARRAAVGERGGGGGGGGGRGCRRGPGGGAAGRRRGHRFSKQGRGAGAPEERTGVEWPRLDAAGRGSRGEGSQSAGQAGKRCPRRTPEGACGLHRGGLGLKGGWRGVALHSPSQIEGEGGRPCLKEATERQMPSKNMEIFWRISFGNASKNSFTKVRRCPPLCVTTTKNSFPW